MIADDDEPSLVTSAMSQKIVVDGYLFSIDIYRLDGDKTWILEVVDQENTSHVWDQQFVSDAEAHEVAIGALELEGALAFMRGSNVVSVRPG